VHLLCHGSFSKEVRGGRETIQGGILDAVSKWLAVVSSVDGLYAVALWRGCRGTSASA